MDIIEKDTADRIKSIAEYLRQNGLLTETIGGYNRFSAEIQDWGNHEQLFLGYYYEQNGDTCPDPVITFVIKDGAVEFGLFHTTPFPPIYAYDDGVGLMVDEMYRRHFADRISETESGDGEIKAKAKTL